MRPNQKKNKREPGSARAAALQALLAWEEGESGLDEALSAALKKNKLEPRDRAFAQLLTQSLVRRHGELASLLKALLNKPLKQSQKELSLILRLSLAQLLFLETPLHAVASTAKSLSNRPHLKGFQGLITAILRRADREGASLLAELDGPRLNTSGWLWMSWAATYGEERARAIAVAHAEDPPVDLSFKPSEDLKAWQEKLGGELLPNGSLRLPRGQGAISALVGYEEGIWWVQDAAARLPAQLLKPKAGELIFDLCAAPGGKTAQLAAQGAKVVALDKEAERLKVLESNLKRLGLSAEITASDLLDWQPEEMADAILLDAPCSATGTLRRHPDGLIQKRPEDVTRLAKLQGRLLSKAASLLKPSGRLVYAVCSLQPEEGVQQIEAFLKDHSDFEIDPIAAAELPDLEEAIAADGALRTLPCHWAEKGGMDGFYACRLLRKA